MVKLPHFSLRELLLSVLLISIGCAGLSTFGWNDKTWDSTPALIARLVLLVSAPAWIGAGIGALFQQPVRGAWLG